MSIHYVPYTYLIGWSWLDTWYYGVAFRKGCNPDQLWKEEKRSSRSYNTSSKIVDKFVEVHGRPDVVRIDCTFETADAARDYESLMIESFDMVADSRYLNKHNPKGKWFHAEPHSEETKEKMRKAKIAYSSFQKREDGTCISSDRVANRTHNLIGPNHNQKQLENGTHSSQIKVECRYCGLICTKSMHTRFHGDKCKKNPDKVEVSVHHWQHKVKKECPYCQKWFTDGNFAMWHGDKCKLNPTRGIVNDVT